MVLVGAPGRILLVNAETERLFGYQRHELVGQPVELLVPFGSREQHVGLRASYFADPHPRLTGAGLEISGLRKDGSEFPAEVLLSPLGPEKGGPLTLAAIRDISDRRTTEDGSSHLAALVRSSDDAIVGQGLDGGVVSWNAAATRLYGYSAEEVLGKPVSVLVPPGHDDELANIVETVRHGQKVVNLETVRARKDGTRVDVSLTVSPVRDDKGSLVGISTIARDVGALVRYREHLRHLAEHDTLTGALNRRRFEADLSAQLARAQRYGDRAIVMVIDIDQFKQINDNYGHQAGDRALKAIAEILQNRLRRTDALARTGGDEFALLLPYAGPDQAAAVAADIRRMVSEFRLDLGGQQPVRLSVSVGTARLDSETVSVDDVLAVADRAMYEDKLGGPGTGG
jgi:diguanylate cyclase (GGDEF)-like protein/PAS domain S-box-containing protein